MDHFDLLVSKFVFHYVFYFIISFLPGCMLMRKEKKTRLLTLNFLRIRELVLVVIVTREIKAKIPVEDETNIVPLFSINLFHATGLFQSPQKTPGFLMFSGDIERNQ